MQEGRAARRAETVSEHFGVKVEDPYRWLELNDPEVRAWAQAQNQRTDEYLRGLPERESLRRRIAAWAAVERRSVPRMCQTAAARQRLFFTQREEARTQPVLCCSEDDGDERVLLDLAPQGLALDWFYPSADGSLVAYGCSAGGTEQSVLHVIGVDRSSPGEAIPGTAHASLAWFSDGSGFYYTRYSSPGDEADRGQPPSRNVYAHRLGTDLRDDELLYRSHGNDYPSVAVTPNGQWLVLRVHRGWQSNAVFVRRVGRGEWIPIATDSGLLFDTVPTDARLYVRTNRGAPRYALYAVSWPEADAGAKWSELVPESADTLDAFVVGRGHHVFASYLSDGSARLRTYHVDSGWTGEIALPELGTIAGLAATPDSPDLFVELTSFARPSELLRFRTQGTGDVARVGRAATEDVSEYEVLRLHATAFDSTLIPMWLVRRRGVAHESRPRPTVLIGYGAFNISMRPKFEPASCAFMEQGGTLVVANLRGGGEFGKDWYEAGLRERKPTVFGDAATCARFLIREGFTSAEQLAFVGESHAGLVGAVLLTQHPELLRAVVCSVPLSDMIRFEQLGDGRLFSDEYGSVDDEREFHCLLSYSPYHRVRVGVDYPAVMITCGDGDSRAHPAHARKLAAALQHAQAAAAPVLFRSEADAGHGIGKPLDRYIDSMTEIYAFLFNELGMSWPRS